MQRTSTSLLLTLGIATAAAVGTLTSDAHAAAKTNCVPDTVQYDQGRLAVNCSDGSAWFYASTSPLNTGCSTNSIDTLKVWESMFMAALLAQKPVDFTYSSGGTCALNIITSNVAVKF